ncbi:HNH endonuclease [Empedobacter brevis]|uniref:HNH endonuclease n=1 Tax=Empedobacter brevis TaxID=247 RepID=UPI0028AF2645|nr:HNH endonuclease [Empedobacter brevis]
MATIDLPKIKVLFEYAVLFQENNISLKKAKEELEKIGVKPANVNFYTYSYVNMIEGRIYKGTINATATRYYLNKIYETKGLEILNNALQALSLHIDYYKNASKANVKMQKKNLDEFTKKYNSEFDKYFEEELESKSLSEGLTKQIVVNIYERNPIARKKCIELHGAVCSVCNFNFEEKYGEIGKGFIHVHHVRELSSIKKEYEIDYKTDLAPVCPNCHAMLHKRKPAYTIEELKNIIQ